MDKLLVAPCVLIFGSASALTMRTVTWGFAGVAVLQFDLCQASCCVPTGENMADLGAALNDLNQATQELKAAVDEENAAEKALDTLMKAYPKGNAPKDVQANIAELSKEQVAARRKQKKALKAYMNALNEYVQAIIELVAR